MKEKTNDGGPAFPVREAERHNPANNETHSIEQHWGMSIRDYFAAQAMQGAIAEGSLRNIATLIQDVYPEMTSEDVAKASNAQLAKRCYAIADAMLAARTEGGAK